MPSKPPQNKLKIDSKHILSFKIGKGLNRIEKSGEKISPPVNNLLM